MNTPDSASNLAADSDAPPAHRRKTMLLRLGMVIGLVAATWGLWYLLFERGMVSTDNAYVAADSAVITPRIAAAVAEVRVTDTQTVKAGDVLVRLDDADARVELASAEAALRQARQRFLQAQANGRSLERPGCSVLRRISVRLALALRPVERSCAGPRTRWPDVRAWSGPVPWLVRNWPRPKLLLQPHEPITTPHSAQ